MNIDNHSEWIATAVKEIESLELLGCWEEIAMEKANTMILPDIWILLFRVKKHAPDMAHSKS